MTYNDGADAYFDGTKILSQLGTVCELTQNVYKDLVASTYYTFYAKWGDITGSAIILFQLTRQDDI